jgi:hypothetical protein
MEIACIVGRPSMTATFSPGCRASSPHSSKKRTATWRFAGGFHVRGACLAPDWHALRTAWEGPLALHVLYADVHATDCPFAEDALGDQYLIRDGSIVRLDGETGDVTAYAPDLLTFDAAVRADPIGYLNLAPLERFRADGGSLESGQLLSVYPPFCMAESADGVSYRAIGNLDRRRSLAALAAQIRAIPDGTPIEIVVRQ